jgi:PAS domain S-box-containing protein
MVSHGHGRTLVPTVFISVLVSLATLLLGSGTWLAYRSESRDRMEGLRREVATSADQLATSLTLPVWYLDHQQIDQILDHLMDNPVVREVSVEVQAGGVEMITRVRGADGSIGKVLAQAPAAEGLIRTERVIAYSGKTLGQVRLACTTRFVEAALHAFLRQSLWSLAGLDLLLVTSLSLLLWWLVLRPLREIQQLAGLVSSGADVAVLPSRATYYGEFASVRQSLLRTFELLKQDIADRKRSEAALREREERYRTFFEYGPDGVVVLDPETERFLEFNDQACRQLGYTREAFQHLTMADIDASESATEVTRHIQKVLKVGSDDFLTLQRTRQGDLRDVHVTAQYIQTGGAPTFHCVWRDFTADKAIEAERRQLHTQLLQSQKMESLGLLAGGIAHDMNNVLSAILGLASAHIGAQPYGSPLHQALDTICKATERGGTMVKSLLSFARHAPAEERALELNEILQEEIHLLERTTLSKIRLEMDLDPGLRPIRGDAGALTHAFMNLCVNSVDAMPVNGTLTFQTRNVGSDWVEVVVKDTGSGMPKEILDKAMDPFFTTKEVGKGTGLGLSMVYSTVKAHGGQMTIESEPGAGTQVRMRFPACEDGVQPMERPADAVPTSREPLRVLLVDDDDLIQSSMQALLEALGHTVTGATCGEEALAQLGRGFKPDLVILDMNMPGLGGGGTLPRLRQMCPKVPVLLSTGRTDQAALDLAAAHPGVTLLPKPFGLRDLQKQFEALGLG